MNSLSLGVLIVPFGVRSLLFYWFSLSSPYKIMRGEFIEKLFLNWGRYYIAFLGYCYFVVGLAFYGL